MDRIKTAVSGSDGSNVRGNGEFVLQCVKSGVVKAEERVSRLQEVLSDLSMNSNVGEDGTNSSDEGGESIEERKRRIGFVSDLLVEGGLLAASHGKGRETVVVV